MSINTYYKSTVSFKRFDKTLDAFGSPIFSATNYDEIEGATNIPCMLKPMSTESKILRGKKVSDRLFVIYCASVAIVEGDTATIDSEVYTVLAIKNPNTLNHHIEIEVEQVI